MEYGMFNELFIIVIMIDFVGRVFDYCIYLPYLLFQSRV